MGVRQKNISGIFRRFLFSFLLAGAATILVLGVIVQILTIKAVIHPANYDEQQLEQKREEIQTAEKVEEKMLAELKNMTLLTENFAVKSALHDSQMEQLQELCTKITDSVNA